MLKIVPKKNCTEPKFIDMGSGAPEMTTMTDHSTKSYFILAEGPRLSDAVFTSQWLLAAIEADRLLQKHFCEKPEFRASIFRLECPYRIAFAMSAMAFVGMWQAERAAFPWTSSIRSGPRYFVSWPALAFLNKRASDARWLFPKRSRLTG
jgi:hypothetical protein